jgi:hypothetical protein
MSEQTTLSKKKKKVKRSSKKKSNNDRGLVVNIVKRDKYTLLFGAISSFLPTGGNNPSDFQFRLGLLNNPSREVFNTQKRAIIQQMLGTQEPKVKLHFSSVDVNNSSTLGIVKTVSVKWSQVMDYSSWSALFDEVRPLEGLCVYRGTYLLSSSTSGGVPVLVGVIDYADSTDLSTFDQGLAFETAKVFSAAAGSMLPEVEWPFYVQGPPDINWLSVTDTSTTWLWWKCVNKQLGGVTVNGGVAVWYGHIILQFRQVK